MRNQNNSKVRYAVVGAGNIAQVAVLPAFAHAKKNSELVAIISSDVEKRAAICKEYGLDVEGDYADLERVLEDAHIDAVYIATPNALHREHALRVANAGVHVLCEKPLATTVADCEAIARACDEQDVKLMVAYRLHFEEATLSAIELVKEGKLGEPRLFESVFSHVVRPGDIRERADMGGGATLDLGIYCINAARNLFQDEPLSVWATTQMRQGVDDTTTAVLQFSKGRIAQFTVSNSIASVSSYRIAGTEGDLRVEPGYEYFDDLAHHLTVDGKTKSKTFGKRDQFAPELLHFSECILEGKTPGPSAEEAICDLRVIEAVLQSASTGQSVTLPPYHKARRPDMSQELKKPAVSKVKPVNAPSPSLK